MIHYDDNSGNYRDDEPLAWWERIFFVVAGLIVGALVIVSIPIIVVMGICAALSNSWENRWGPRVGKQGTSYGGNGKENGLRRVR